jgi:hypothetical protein
VHVAVDFELFLTGLVAMLEPATLITSALALVVGHRPLRTGFWFYVGGFGATFAVGVVAAFVLGDAAAETRSGPKTWVAIVTTLAGAALLVYVARAVGRPVDEEKMAANVARMDKLATASPLAIAAAGALLANAGPFMLIAIKAISQLDPSRAQFVIDWLLFAFASMLPLAIAMVLLVIAPGWTMPRLAGARRWLEAHARAIALTVIGLLSISLLRDGIAGLT